MVSLLCKASLCKRKDFIEQISMSAEAFGASSQAQAPQFQLADEHIFFAWLMVSLTL